MYSYIVDKSPSPLLLQDDHNFLLVKLFSLLETGVIKVVRDILEGKNDIFYYYVLEQLFSLVI